MAQQQTKNDCFVLAYFCGYLGIRPAVYKKHGKRIGLIDIYKENIYYKTFYLYESDANKNYSVRVYRIKNKLTKTQMIVFASENATLNIRINNTVIPPIVPENKIANFSKSLSIPLKSSKAFSPFLVAFRPLFEKIPTVSKGKSREYPDFITEPNLDTPI